MTRREIVERLEMQARRRAQQQAELSRPWWFDGETDTQPLEREGRDGGPQMLAHALMLCALVLVLVGLACRAWVIEDDLAAVQTRETVQQMEGGR